VLIVNDLVKFAKGKIYSKKNALCSGVAHLKQGQWVADDATILWLMI
jgi:hypothetical protein